MCSCICLNACCKQGIAFYNYNKYKNVVIAASVPAWPVVARVQSHEASWFLDVSAPWAVVVPFVFSSWLYSCAPRAFGLFVVFALRVFGRIFVVFAWPFGASRCAFVFGAHIHVHLAYQLPGHFVACSGTPRSMCGRTRTSHFVYCRVSGARLFETPSEPQRAISVHFFSLSPSTLHV